MTYKPITSAEIIHIHTIFEGQFKIPRGHVKIGDLEVLIEKSRRLPFSTERIDVVEQAAILLEGLTRLHIFVDGNKRTALEATRMFLNRNRYALIVPLSGTDFIYRIARAPALDSDKAIHEIKYWLLAHSAPTNQPYRVMGLIVVYVLWPMWAVKFFGKIRLRRCSRWLVKKYLINQSDPNITKFMLEIYEKQFKLLDAAIKETGTDES